MHEQYPTGDEGAAGTVVCYKNAALGIHPSGAQPPGWEWPFVRGLGQAPSPLSLSLQGEIWNKNTYLTGLLEGLSEIPFFFENSTNNLTIFKHFKNIYQFFWNFNSFKNLTWCWSLFSLRSCPFGASVAAHCYPWMPGAVRDGPRVDSKQNLHVRNRHCQQLQLSLFTHICGSWRVRLLRPGPSKLASLPRNSQTEMSPSQKAISKKTWTLSAAGPGCRGATDVFRSWHHPLTTALCLLCAQHLGSGRTYQQCR